MSKFEDLKDRQFGNWKVLEYIGKSMWKCECQCENKTVKEVHGYSLKTGKSTSCGCERKKIVSKGRLDDLSGQTFGNWKVLSYSGNSMWKCECQCENRTIRDVKAQSLKSGKSTSCGHDSTGFKDIKGQVYRTLEAVRYTENNKWLCRCLKCGKEKEVELYNLTKGMSACECDYNYKSKNFIDITGETFGELKAIKYLGDKLWLCKCSCNNITVKTSEHLRRSTTISCGCKEDVALSKEEVISRINKYIEEKGELPFRNDLTYILDRSITTVNRYIEKFDLMQYINKSYRSKAERDIQELFKTPYVNCRNILEGYELDLYYPDVNFAIEFNGNYWHSEIYKDKEYHKNKTLSAFNKNIKLFHIFEYEWEDEIKRNKIINILNEKLNKTENKVVYARNTKIKEINYSDACEFLEEYHLQGSIKSSIYLGCYFNNELIGVMTFGNSRFDTYSDYEMHRLCWKNTYKVIGGTEKLFKYFIKNYNPASIVTYCDISKFTGNVYKRLGFNCKGLTASNYVWWSNGYSVLTRYQAQKHKLIEKGLGTEEQTESEIMTNLGYVKIYDCGNLKFEWPSDKN